MKKVALVALALTVAVLATACASGPKELSMRVTVDDKKSDGKEWDWRPAFGPSGESWWAQTDTLASRFPDLVLTVIAEDGSVQEFLQPAGASGSRDSFCEDRLTCSWTVSAPGSYYAVIATDLDTGVSVRGVVDTIVGFFGGQTSHEKPLQATSEFAGAVIVTNGWFGPDEGRVAALDAKVHEYLEQHGGGMGPGDAIGVLKAGDCADACALDESGTVRLTIG